MSFGVVAAVGAGIVVGGMMGGGPDIPDTSPTQQLAIASQERIAEKQLGQQDRMFDYFRSRQDRLDPLEESITRRQMGIAEDTASQGRDLFNYQQRVFRPVEESLVAQSMAESTPSFYERYAQEAAARIATGQATAEAGFERDMSGMGVNPNSGAYAAGRRGLQLSDAAQRGAGMNEARDRAEALGWARRADIAGLGKGLVGAGNASYGLAIQGNSSALTGANETTRTAASTLGTPMQYGQMGMQASMNAGTLSNDIYRTQAQIAATPDPAMQAAGQAVGMWAGGGFKM